MCRLPKWTYTGVYLRLLYWWSHCSWNSDFTPAPKHLVHVMYLQECTPIKWLHGYWTPLLTLSRTQKKRRIRRRDKRRRRRWEEEEMEQQEEKKRRRRRRRTTTKEEGGEEEEEGCGVLQGSVSGMTHQQSKPVAAQLITCAGPDYKLYQKKEFYVYTCLIYKPPPGKDKIDKIRCSSIDPPWEKLTGNSRGGGEGIE